MSLPVRSCQEILTVREFLDWQCYFETKWNMPTKADFYMAKIAQTVHAVSPGADKPMKIKEFVLDYNEIEEISEDDEFKFQQRHLAMQKATMQISKKKG